MNRKKRQRITDFLELLIVFMILFMIFVIYVPVAIWEEEAIVQDESHFRMEDIYNLESFYHQLTDDYEKDGFWAMNVVNAVRDSLIADSTYIDTQVLTLFEKEISVNIPKGFDVEYDTTFGFHRSRRDTITDTTMTVVVFSEELARNDTMFIQKKSLTRLQSEPNFREIIAEEPVQRIESVTYYDTYIPDSSYFYCPLTHENYTITIQEDKIRISSPIVDKYKEKRFLIFAFVADNHGYIDDGFLSWNR